MVAAILDPAENMLLNFEVEALPLEITTLADDVRSAVRPQDACSNGGVHALANDARANIVTIARKRGFRRSMTSTIATETHARIAGNESLCSGTTDAISDAVADTVIEAGADLSGGLFTLASDARANIVTIARKQSLDHRFIVRTMASRSAPAVDGPTKVFVSRDGRSNLVAWQGEDGAIRYVESAAGDDSWSEVHELKLDTDLDQVETQQLLGRRLDG